LNYFVVDIKHQCSSLEDTAIREEVLKLNYNEPCRSQKNAKGFPHSPGGECRRDSIIPVDQSQDNTHKDASKLEPVPISSPCLKNKAGNCSSGWGNKIIDAKSDSPQSPQLIDFSEQKSYRNTFFQDKKHP
jgi:hypothetical protein